MGRGRASWALCGAKNPTKPFYPPELAWNRARWPAFLGIPPQDSRARVDGFPPGGLPGVRRAGPRWAVPYLLGSGGHPVPWAGKPCGCLFLIAWGCFLVVLLFSCLYFWVLSFCYACSGCLFRFSALFSAGYFSLSIVVFAFVCDIFP